VLPWLNFGIQCLIFGGLVWYAIETWRIRNIAQQQVEAAYKPCLTFSTGHREPTDAVLSTGGAVGDMVIQGFTGQVQLENIGSGPAFNIRYKLTPTNLDSTPARPSGYVPSLKAAGPLVLPISLGLLSSQWECIILYESLSGCRYQTTLTTDNLVLTSIRFRAL
jgi:hypothetical protein